MDQFSHWKQIFLAKKDKSKKGGIDASIEMLLDYINKKDNYFTTSSCSGRICVRAQARGARKNELGFLLQSHGMVRMPVLLSALKNISLDAVWFRFEPMILHVACRDVEYACILLDAIRPLFKHSGIISVGKKVVLEIRGSEFIEAPIAVEGKLVVDNAYLRILLKEANEKLKITHQKIKNCATLLA